MSVWIPEYLKVHTLAIEFHLSFIDGAIIGTIDAYQTIWYMFESYFNESLVTFYRKGSHYSECPTGQYTGGL